MAKYQPMKDQLYGYMLENPDKEKKEIVEHFATIGINRRTIYRWISTIETTGTIQRKISCGRPVTIGTKPSIRWLKKYFDHRSGRSQTKAAAHLKCTQPYISHILKKYTKIRCRKKVKRPIQTEKQRQATRPKCRKMLEQFKDVDFVVDDESYFTLRHTVQPGNNVYYSSDPAQTPASEKFDYRAKYEQKLLVWLAISSKGISQPYFVPSGMAINQDVYLGIIQNFLEPFLSKYYAVGGYVFWPDLASAHYAKRVQNYLRTKNISFVPKDINPANVPKARPIEDFWANLKFKVYEENWEASDLEQLKRKIKKCLTAVDPSVVQAHMSTVRSRLDKIRRHGI